MRISAHCKGTSCWNRAMCSESMDREKIFHAAIALADPAGRAAFLAAACQQDAELRADIDELLKHDAEAGDFLAMSAVTVVETDGQQQHAEPAGTVIGPYKLL